MTFRPCVCRRGSCSIYRSLCGLNKQPAVGTCGLEIQLMSFCHFFKNKPHNQLKDVAKIVAAACWLPCVCVCFFPLFQIAALLYVRLCVYSFSSCFVWARRALWCHVCTFLSCLLNCEWQDVSIRGLGLDFNSNSGGIIQRNVIYSLLVSLTPDLNHLTRLP